MDDVRDIGMRPAKDREIIEYALRNNRIIITRDTDFGEVLRYPKHPGAVIFRLPYGFTMKEINERLEEFLQMANFQTIPPTDFCILSNGSTQSSFPFLPTLRIWLYRLPLRTM